MIFLVLTFVPLTTSLTSDYVKDLRGSSPIVLSCPHGSKVYPKEFPNRKIGCFDPISGNCSYLDQAISDCKNTDDQLKECTPRTMSDYNTHKVCEHLKKQMEELGADPYVVILEIARKKVDVNRDEFTATQGNKYAKEVYDHYHQKIKDFLAHINGPALLFDIHGHGHPKPWIELGYNLKGYQLKKCNYKPANTTLLDLYERSQIKNKFIQQFVYGNQSLSHFIKNEEESIEVVPSEQYHHPGEEKYFSGGFITKTYSKYDEVSAIQIELPRCMRKY